MKKNKFLIIIPLMIIIFSFFIMGTENTDAVENLEIVAGIGNDIKCRTHNLIEYSVPLSAYVFDESGESNENTRISSIIRDGTARTLGATRENRQSISDKKSILGFEKVYVVSESNAFYGIGPIMSILFRNPQLNDTGYFVICKGKARDMLSYKVKGYPSSSDFIEGLLKNEFNYTFFPRDTKITNVYSSLYVEGVNPVIPYIEIGDEGIKVSGMALFRNEHMIAKSDFHDSKWINLMRNDKGYGIVSLQKDSKNYSDFYANSSRKVQVDKIDGKLHFTINLRLKGDIITNTYFKDLSKNKDVKKAFEKEIEEEVRKNCYSVINKMKSEYKVDCIGLGQYAAARYGRWTNTDWNREVLNSSIDVNVKASIKSWGRGSFENNGV